MFPDIANVLAIREALWRHRALGSASIMVGAGFSRNSDPVGSSARSMPTWAEMAEALCRPLYPVDAPRLQAALAEARGTSGFLRLAQEYQVAFGAAALNDRIRSLAPDTDYRPSDLHRRLLRLPWGDVFSTNWDTLLERAQPDVFNRSYDVIRTPDEIPFTKRPRIVKLHGSFPAHQPFVFTEDDYRTYPVTHAPFVNLVQQSMMETLFCLIGFSGDDPNFLHWAGWVKDNLGSSAPRIYLVGWLEMSNHRRRMLEARNVMPIDLSALPAASAWPAEHRHRYAAEWFIAAMERGERYDPSNWPSPPPADAGPTRAILGDIPVLEEATPVRTAWSPSDSSAEIPANVITQTIAWRANRHTYPGWLVAPGHIRDGVWRQLERWFAAFKDLSNLTPLQRLEALVELAWQMDLCLCPLFTDFDEAAFAALEEIDLLGRKVGDEEIKDWSRWTDLMAMSDRLALSLARNGRHNIDRPRFERALALVSERSMHDTALLNSVTYEACLWDNATGDLGALTTRLAGWITVHGDALWTLRKAGLLAELREDARACELLEEALGIVRRGRRRDIDDIPSLSLESWAMYLALAYDRSRSVDQISLPRDMPPPFVRWRELAPLDCDAHGDYRALVKTLQINNATKPAITEQRGFDLNHAATTHHWGSGWPENVRASYAALMVSEVTAIPPVARHTVLLEEGARPAALVLADKEPWMAAHWAVRMQLNRSQLDELIDRRWVARLPLATAKAIRDAMLKRTAFMLARMSDANRGDDANDVATCLEMLSRVAVRLPASDLIILANEALGYFQAPVFSNEGRRLWRPLRNLLSRILEAMPPAALAELAPVLFDAALPVDPGGPSDDERVDPVLLLPSWFEMDGGPNNQDSAWRGIIDRLISAVSGGPKARSAAVSRLQRLYESGLMNEAEASLYADRLWAPSRLTPEGLPDDTVFFPWVAVRMPERERGQAHAALTRVMQGILTGEQSDEDALHNLANLILPLSREKAALDLDADVARLISERISRWAASNPPAEGRLYRMFDSSFASQRKTTAAVATLLTFITPDDALRALLWQKREALDAHEDMTFHAYVLYPALAGYQPDRASELLIEIRRGLASDTREEVRGALDGLFRWLYSNGPNEGVIGDELKQTVREVGIGIAACRRSLLWSGLNLARWLFKSGPEDFRDLIAADCDRGLLALSEIASYEAEDSGLDVPYLRSECVRLALAMNRNGFGAGPGVGTWLALAPDDPLPEVRHAGSRRKGGNIDNEE